jgi:hypothetical protein
MATLTPMTIKATISEANIIVNALLDYRKVMAFNMRAVAATEDEKREAAQQLLACEALLRTLGAEMPPLKVVKMNPLDPDREIGDLRGL